MIGNISRVSRKGSKGDKGDVPSLKFRVDENGNLWLDSDGILVDKEYADSRNFVVKSELERLEDKSNKIQSVNELINDEQYLSAGGTLELAIVAEDNAKAHAEGLFGVLESRVATNEEIIVDHENRISTNEEVISQNRSDIIALEDKDVEFEREIADLQKHVIEESHFRGYLADNPTPTSPSKATPNDFVYSATSGTKWVYDAKNGWVDTGVPVPDQLVPAYNDNPEMNGDASAGISNEYARGDHRHPTDTTRASVKDVRINTESIAGAFAYCGELNERVTNVENAVGEFETALDTAIALCDGYISGGAV